ncbi:MAG: aldolase/citrate lyase family protein [Actinomycetota bacterium]|nr:aldolase/citrate lyase family protein [Actinomycetota bacterium]
MKDIILNFNDKISKRPVFGFFSKTTDPAFIECMGHAGLDFVILDMEHGPNNLLNLSNLIRASQLVNILPVVRIKEGDNNLISNVLDLGAGGVQIPHIKTKKDITTARQYSKFFPEGSRGMCRFVRAADYSATDQYEYFKNSNKTINIIQIEGKEGLENIDEIIDYGGFDILFIGPYDLSQSLGIPGKVDDPPVENAMKKITAKCAEKNITVGTFCDNTESAKKWINAGVRYISYSVDVGIFYAASKKIADELKKL